MPPKKEPNDRSEQMQAAVEVFKKVWTSVKNPSYCTVSGYLAEALAFDKLKHLPVVRSFEGSNEDGALVISRSPFSSAKLPTGPSANWLNKWQWATTQQGAKFVTLDWKYVQITPSSVGARTYCFSGPSDIKRQDCELIGLIFEDDRYHVVLVPKAIWNLARDVSYGVHPLICRMPAWCTPFAVSRKDLEVALQRIAKAALSQVPYVNPTTGVTITGWTPNHTTTPKLKPTGDASEMRMRSFQKVVALFAELKQVGCEVDFMPTQPLIADFMVKLPGQQADKKWLWIEHKYQKTLDFAKGSPSPFSALRVWHFLVIEPVDHSNSTLCIPRHRVQSEWEGSSKPLQNVDLQPFSFKGDKRYRDIVAFMQRHADGARDCADKITLSGSSPDPAGIVSLRGQEMLNLDFQEVSEVQEELTRRRAYDVALPWLTEVLNHQCAQSRRGFFHPLDYGHPVGNHIFVDHNWSDEDVANYKKSAYPPLPVHHKTMSGKVAIPLRFQDWTPIVSSKNPAKPLYIRKSSWRKPATKQQFIIVGKMLRGPDGAKDWEMKEFAASTLFCMPSEHTTQFDKGVQALRSVDPKGYLQKRPLEKDVLPSWTNDKDDMPVETGCAFLQPKISPLRNVLDGRGGANEPGSLLNFMMHLVHDQQNVTVSDGCSQTNPAFDPRPYRTTVQRMLQFAYDCGLYRKPASLKKLNDDEEDVYY